jgi:23S rRNA (uracil1939-C5)-methyltransferase
MSNRVTIEKLVFGGYGIARTDSGVMFVGGVAPGETVIVEPVGRQGGSTIARPLEILEASSSRRAPPCPFVDRCGGCDWLHLDYRAQLEEKKKILHECLIRTGRLMVVPEVELIHADEFHYRHRAQIKIGRRGEAGFFARRSNEVVEVNECPLLLDPLNALLGAMHARRIAVPEGTVHLMVFAGDAEMIASSPQIPERTLHSAPITVAGRRFFVTADGFFQSNRPLLERFGTWPRSYLYGDRCIDLYGGSGFFSVMLAERFAQIQCIESIGSQVVQAAAHFRENGFEHVSAIESSAELVIKIVAGKTVDCIIVDPPRPGLSRKVCESITRLKPRQVLYVSCNPSTQARDLGYLINQGAYSLEKIALFDLYPNTHHMESMAILRYAD